MPPATADSGQPAQPQLNNHRPMCNCEESANPSTSSHCYKCLEPIKPITCEAQLQADVVAYARARFEPATGAIMVHHNNNQSNKVAGARARAAGVRKAMPDCQLIMPGGRSAFIELKMPGKKPSPDQRDMHAHLTKLGHECYVCTSLAEAVFVCEKLLNLPHTQETTQT